MKTFEQWDIDDLERTFNLERQTLSPLLDALLDARYDVTAVEQAILSGLQENLAADIDLWNEDELKFKFIAPLINIVRYDTALFHTFTQRTLTAVVAGVRLSGRIDFMVASGKSKPLCPYFFLHEYKKTFAPNGNPLAQVLSAMLAARILNDDAHPVYGCYVVGRSWFFVLLDSNHYAVSDAFLATKSDIYAIFSVLKEVKALITRRLQPAMHEQ